MVGWESALGVCPHGRSGRNWGRCRLRFSLKSAASDRIPQLQCEARMRRHVRFWVVALGWSILAPGATQGIACGAPAEDPNKTQAISSDRDGLRQAILPVFARYCASCHGPDRPKGGLNLESLHDEGTFQSRRRAWVRIRENLEGGIMPPEDSAQPSRADLDRAIGAIKSMLARDDCGKPLNPGRVTIRRLNRAEY